MAANLHPSTPVIGDLLRQVSTGAIAREVAARAAMTIRDDAPLDDRHLVTVLALLVAADVRDDTGGYLLPSSAFVPWLRDFESYVAGAVDEGDEPLAFDLSA